VPAFSIVMPVFNGARFLDRAIASLRAQPFTDWELLAVDDASIDSSAAHLDAVVRSDPRVRVFRHSANRGPAAARNTALAAATGELVAYLDCDDEFYPDHLARACALRDRADVLLFRYDLIEERTGHPHSGAVTTHDPGTRLRYLSTETIAVPLGVVHRRALFARAGSFDERLWRDEDGDLWRRFAAAGATFAGVTHTSGRYHIRADSLARTGPRTRTGLPSPVGTVEIQAGGQRYTLRIATGEAWLAREVFERHEYGGLPAHALRRPPLVVDVGANVGAFALYAKLAYHPDAVIHCFEPYPPNVALLRRNVAPFPAVTVHPVGLGVADAEVDLLLHATNSGANSTRSDLVPAPAGRTRVPIRDAGAIWDELGFEDVDVLKIDAEGAEVGILEAVGARLGRVRVVLAEYHAAEDRRRIDALLPGHVLFGLSFHDLRRGVVKYLRADLVR
jgi:FkbM family methyltransferase